MWQNFSNVTFIFVRSAKVRNSKVTKENTCNRGSGTTSKTAVTQNTLTATAANEQLLQLWLGGKSPNTTDYYRRSVERFLVFVGKPLHLVTFAEVRAFANHLESLELKSASRRSILSAVRSLLSFAHQVGILESNVGAPLKLPTVPETLSQRLLTPMQVQLMIALEPNERNRAIIMMLYYAGIRVSELCRLTWGDLQAVGDKAQVTVKGKGNKNRVVLLPPHVWQEIIQLRATAGEDEPVFISRKHNTGGHLHRYHVDRIVKAAARRAKIPHKVSPHSLRHAHASHALEGGAKIHLVQATLGHSSVAVTSRYLHARPDDSSGLYLPT